MIKFGRWEKEFSLLVLSSMILSGLFYGVQFYIFNGMDYDRYGISSNLIRCVRMLLIYVIPVLYFQNRNDRSWRSLGVLPSKQYPILSTFGGISVYFIAIYVFLHYRVFFGGWNFMPALFIIINQLLIGIMASVTDFWTRGFILLEIADRYNHKIAILVQNLVWFVLHIYEIDLLSPYIGLFGGLLLTLTLGILGDLIALKTRSIFGLMMGHILLNVAIVLGANGIIKF